MIDTDKIEGSLVEQPTSFSRADIADYIATMTRELRTLADEGGLNRLSALIQAVETEAENIAREITGRTSATRRMLRKFA